MEEIPKQLNYQGKRIVLYGPESTGKSTIAQELALHYNSIFIPEFAREYLQRKWDESKHVCTLQDLKPIAVGQRNLENQATLKGSDYVFCDTDILETYVYSLAYFNQVPLSIEKAIHESHYDLYLLMDVDISWVKDDLRDKPEEREEMFHKFEAALQTFNKPYKRISGKGSERLKNAIAAIDSLSI
ncbi:MAG: ATP-binding protein [Bacteroidota bacterium]|nr:ATP-binding protein [Bacteroidota bacterium]